MAETHSSHRRSVRSRLAFLTAFLAAAALPLSTASAQSGSDVYVGTVVTFAFDWCPADFMPAAGQTLPMRSYMALYSVIGVRYGGDGQTTFMLPDLRARSVVGAAQSGGDVGQKVGAANVTLTSAQVPLLPHTHGATFTPITGSTPISIPGTPGSLTVQPTLAVKKTTGQAAAQEGSLLAQGGVGQNSAPIYAAPGAAGDTASLGGLGATVSGTAPTAATTVNVNTVTGGTVTIAPAGQGATVPVPTQSPAMTMMTCIAVNGLYPPRP